MRTKIIHGIDDNVNFDRCLTYNNNLPNSDPYKLSENDFDARWLAVQPICSRSECQPENEEVIFYSCPSECENSSENYQPCMNCVYYGEFKVIEDAWYDHKDRYFPAVFELVKPCLNCQCISEEHNSDIDLTLDDDCADSVS